MKENIIKESMTEAVGTFLLVFFGCGAIVINESSGGTLGLLGVALAFGLLVMTIVLAIGHISGAHINPAVTIAFACTKKFPWKHVPPYVVAQILGAIVGALVLKCTLASGDSLGMTLPSESLGQAFFLEVILTAFLMFVVTSVATDARAQTEFAALAIGATIVIDIFVGGLATGASMNPARSLGPALVAMNFDGLWLYVTAPIIGAIVGAFGYIFCASNSKNAPGVDPHQ